MLEENGQLSRRSCVRFVDKPIEKLSDTLRELLRLENKRCGRGVPESSWRQFQRNRLPYRHITASLITALGRERRLGDMKHVYDLVQGEGNRRWSLPMPRSSSLGWLLRMLWSMPWRIWVRSKLLMCTVGVFWSRGRGSPFAGCLWRIDLLRQGYHG